MSRVSASSQAMYSGAETAPFLGIGKVLKMKFHVVVKMLSGVDYIKQKKNEIHT